MPVLFLLLFLVCVAAIVIAAAQNTETIQLHFLGWHLHGAAFTRGDAYSATAILGFLAALFLVGAVLSGRRTGRSGRRARAADEARIGELERENAQLRAGANPGAPAASPPAGDPYYSGDPTPAGGRPGPYPGAAGGPTHPAGNPAGKPAGNPSQPAEDV